MMKEKLQHKKAYQKTKFTQEKDIKNKNLYICQRCEQKIIVILIKENSLGTSK